MATIVQSYTAPGGSSTQSTTGVPGSLVVTVTDGDGNILGDTGNATLITAAAVTTSQVSSDQINTDGRGVIVVLDMTAVGTGSVTLTVQGKDPASGKYFTLLAGAAVTTNVTNVYTVYPGVSPVTANVSASTPLPRTWRVSVAANNANAATYTVGASVVV